MADGVSAASFTGDSPAAAEPGVIRDRKELALVAVERTRMPMIVTDPRQPDNPIVLADVTPAFHPAATRDRPVLSRMSAGEATGGVNPARCCSRSAAKAAGVA